MTLYFPNLTSIYQGRPLSPVPITESFLRLEKAINGKVDRANFSKEESLGLRSFHRKSLSESHRGRQLIWQEPAVWVFFWRKAAGSTNEYDHLGRSNNSYSVEEASVRATVPHNAIVRVSSQIQIESYRFSGNDQSGVHGSGMPFGLATTSDNGTTASYTAAQMPSMELTFTLRHGTPGSPVTTILDEVVHTIQLETNTAALPTDALGSLRRGFTVNLYGVHQVQPGDDLIRIGTSVDYWVDVTAAFTEDGTRNLSADEVAYITVRSLSRNISATVYHAASMHAPTTGIHTP